MKKLVSLLALPALLSVTSCTQEQLPKNEGGEVMTQVKLTLPDMKVESRAFSETGQSFDNMRVYLFVYYGDKLVDCKNLSSTNFASDSNGNYTCNIDVRLVTGNAYKLVAWADYGGDYYDVEYDVASGNKATVAYADKNTTTDEIDIIGNSMKYDAFYGEQNVTLDNSGVINMTLTRPFGLVRVETRDWNENSLVNAGLRPEKYQTTLQAYAGLSLFDGTPMEESSIIVKGDIENTGTSINELSYTYFFAPKDGVQDQLNFEAEYLKGDGTSVCGYDFKNIPIQRNYITNVMGNILTKLGDVKMQITDEWYKPDLSQSIGASGAEIVAILESPDFVFPEEGVYVANVTEELTEGFTLDLSNKEIKCDLELNIPYQNMTAMTFKGVTIKVPADYSGVLYFNLGTDLGSELPTNTVNISTNTGGTIYVDGCINTVNTNAGTIYLMENFRNTGENPYGGGASAIAGRYLENLYVYGALGGKQLTINRGATVTSEDINRDLTVHVPVGDTYGVKANSLINPNQNFNGTVTYVEDIN